MRPQGRRSAGSPHRSGRPRRRRPRRARAAAPARARRTAAPPRASRSTRPRPRPARPRSPRPRATGRSPPTPARRPRDPGRRARAAGRSRAPRPAASPAAPPRPPPRRSRGRAAAPRPAPARAPPGAAPGRAPSARPPSARIREWKDRRSREHMFYTNTCSPVNRPAGLSSWHGRLQRGFRAGRAGSRGRWRRTRLARLLDRSRRPGVVRAARAVATPLGVIRRRLDARNMVARTRQAARMQFPHPGAAPSLGDLDLLCQTPGGVTTIGNNVQ